MGFYGQRNKETFRLFNFVDERCWWWYVRWVCSYEYMQYLKCRITQWPLPIIVALTFFNCTITIFFLWFLYISTLNRFQIGTSNWYIYKNVTKINKVVNGPFMHLWWINECDVLNLMLIFLLCHKPNTYRSITIFMNFDEMHINISSVSDVCKSYSGGNLLECSRGNWIN